MRRRLVVGLDYGTSNSGACYTIVHDDDQHHTDDDDVVIRNWPCAAANRDARGGVEKVPSEIAYDSAGQPNAHGFEAARCPKRLQWVKLLLEPAGFATRSDRTSRVWDLYYELDAKRPVDVVADYLRWLWQTVKAAILKIEDDGESHVLFHPAHLTVVLTVPASWDAVARQRLANAAVDAGIPEQCIKMLAEPEAAAVYGLKKRARQRYIQKDDCVLVCDAGGGTVDVVVYQVLSREPLLLDQKTMSKGDFCGSSFVNREFRNQLQLMLGEKFDRLSREAKDRIDDEFEHDIKRAYNPFATEGEHAYYISVDELEDDEALGIHNGKMKIEEAIIYAAFDSVMTQVWALIDDQRVKLRAQGLEANLKGLLLVGGFGKSEFLRHRLKQELSERNDPKVWATDDAWTAVVRGAVSCEASALGRQAPIHSRLSGYNYGIPFVDHMKRRKVHWLVRKGESVRSNMATEPYGLRIDDAPWLDEDVNCLVYVPIVTSGDDNATDDYTDAVRPHANIKCRVPTAQRLKPEAKLVQTAPNKAWHIPATLVLYFDGALISFRCKIDDQEVGVAEVKYFQEDKDCVTAHGDRDGDAEGESEPEPEHEPEIPEKTPRGHVRKDSKITTRSETSSLTSLVHPRTKSKENLVPAPLIIHKETGAATPTPSTSSVPSTPSTSSGKKSSKHKGLFGMGTHRDKGKTHSPKAAAQHWSGILGPSSALNLPKDERLDQVYRKGWVPREAKKKKAD